MAEALVSVVLEQLASIFRLELQQEVNLVLDVPKEVTNLTTTLSIIKVVLEDAEERQVKNEAVKVWLGELKDIVYDADDVLDEWNTRIFISRVKGKVHSYLLSSCSCFRPAVVRHDIGHKIKDIRERLDVIAHAKNQFNLIEIKSYYQDRPRQVTSSVVDVAEIHGRDLDKEIVVSRLVGESSQEIAVPVPVISIVGMGGIGKTTLAQLVLNEDNVMTMFERIMWVCVSESFELERVAREVIEQATGGNVPNVAAWEVLHRSLCNSVKEKRFLLVLDDVWSEDHKDWSPLKLALDCGARGSRILVTTRNEGVANMIGSTYTHRLGQLLEDDCWSLFRHIAFWGRSQEEHEKFEEIGVEIAKKCKGVPLAAKAVASLMRFKRTKQDWRNVLASEIWEVQQVETSFLPALMLSYHALPPCLKQCFLFCAIYPKDKVMEKDELVKLWMAQGFIGSDEGKELEMIGGDYFDDLAMRSFFQDFYKDNDGKIIFCKMHDLVHDFVQFLTKTECSILEKNDNGFSSNKVRHIHAWSIESPSIYIVKNLRTLILRQSNSSLSESFRQLTCLRALDLSGSNLEKLPSKVDRLLHLRYLNLSNTDLRELPETMCCLYNLQTLKLNYCQCLLKLPEGIGRLSNLRHVELKVTDELRCFPQRFGRLILLRTLCKFIVSGASGGCTIGELGNLNYLQGNLEIIGLRQVENVNEAKRAELQRKKNLRSLELDFDYFRRVNEDDIKRMEGVLEGLQPHNNLEEMKITGYPGSIFPCWMSSESVLSNIVKLELYKAKKCTGLPALGKLRSLESLDIVGLVSVKHIGPEFFGFGVDTSEDITFPMLKKLKFDNMEEWEDWEFPFSKFKKIMPRLCHLTLLSCPKLMELPALAKLESLEILKINELSSVKGVGAEFLGISDDVDSKRRTVGGGESVQQKQVVFPRLTELTFSRMNEWEEWSLPFQKDNVIMPHLRELMISRCRKLKTLPALGKLQSLEDLTLWDLDAVKPLSAQLLGISGGGAGNRESTSSSSPMITIFPKLAILGLISMPEWEEQHDEMVLTKSDTSTTGGGSGTTASAIMPCLHTLHISECSKLRAVPHYMFSQELRKLEIQFCPQLTGIQPCLPPLLEELLLWGDIGVLSVSLPINNTNNYPNLKNVTINSSPHSALCQELNQFTSLQQLQIYYCKFLDFRMEELKQFSNLQELIISRCPILVERCREDWSILSHIPKIIIDNKEITERN